MPVDYIRPIQSGCTVVLYMFQIFQVLKKKRKGKKGEKKEKGRKKQYHIIYLYLWIWLKGFRLLSYCVHKLQKID
jgi:hypothetical protein